METCTQCDKVISDPDKAIYDGELQSWFCSHTCLGRYHAALGGDVPA